jgi:hypothetical protein
LGSSLAWGSPSRNKTRKARPPPRSSCQLSLFPQGTPLPKTWTTRPCPSKSVTLWRKICTTTSLTLAGTPTPHYLPLPARRAVPTTRGNGSRNSWKTTSNLPTMPNFRSRAPPPARHKRALPVLGTRVPPSPAPHTTVTGDPQARRWYQRRSPHHGWQRHLPLPHKRAQVEDCHPDVYKQVCLWGCVAHER